MNGPRAILEDLRRRISPDHPDEGWASLWSLIYLGFLFMNWNGRSWSVWLLPTVVSIIIFLPLYLRALRDHAQSRLRYAAAVAVLGFALSPLNTGGNNYLIYAGAIVGSSGIGMRRSILVIGAGLLVYAAALYAYGYPVKYVLLMAMVTGLVAVAIGVANHFQREKRLRQAELKLSHDEIRRLAATAERERIGRDLHDLLGHTLSLITLKSELAVKLFDRDALAARREIVDVERVARDALGQVRRAVVGIRAAGLSAELASARLLLESSDVRLEYPAAPVALPAGIETVLALVVREAVTNIQRHARATHARVDVVADGGEVRLTVADDGVGAAIVPGNGLGGMRERLALLDGRLEIASERGRGTRVVAYVPLPASTATAATGAIA